jgi:hypothetical protein
MVMALLQYVSRDGPSATVTVIAEMFPGVPWLFRCFSYIASLHLTSPIPIALFSLQEHAVGVYGAAGAPAIEAYDGGGGGGGGDGGIPTRTSARKRSVRSRSSLAGTGAGPAVSNQVVFSGDSVDQYQSQSQSQSQSQQQSSWEDSFSLRIFFEQYDPAKVGET